MHQNAVLCGNGLTLSQTINFRLFQTQKTLQTTISSLMKMAESYPNGKKTLWEKEKLLVTSNFSFSHSIFKRLKLQTRKNQGLFGKRLSNNENKSTQNKLQIQQFASGK